MSSRKKRLLPPPVTTAPPHRPGTTARDGLPPWVVLGLGICAGSALTAVLRSGSPAPAAPAPEAPIVAAPIVAAPSPAKASAQPIARPATPPESARPLQVADGPWGQVEFTPVWQVPPQQNVQREVCPTALFNWSLPDYTQARLDLLLDHAGLSPALRAEARQRTSCAPSGTGCTLSPSVALIGGLSAEARGQIYRALGQHMRNFYQYYSFRFHAADIDPWFERSGMSPELQARARALFFQESGDLWSFADLAYLCSTLPAADGQSLMRALNSETSYVGRLWVRRGQDIAGLLRYWGGGDPERERQLRPLFESLARSSGGGSVDVGYLLPPMPRARLNTYPGLDDPERLNCIWTAMNFSSEHPDPALQDSAVAAEVLRRDYVEVRPDELRLGDVLTIERGGALFHTAVYIADGMYLTKNGRTRLRAWMLSPRQPIRELYPLHDGLREVYYRKR